MPGLNGFELLDKIERSRCPHIVFVTAYDEFALKAFEVGALDYLLKPFDEERLSETLDRVRLRIGDAGATLPRAPSEFLRRYGQSRQPERLAIRQHNETLLIKTETVDWFESESNYVTVHVGDESYLMRGTLAGLETTLDPFRFIRIHRRIIVNLDRVRSLVPCGHGDYRAILANGTELNVSRRYTDRINLILSGDQM